MNKIDLLFHQRTDEKKGLGNTRKKVRPVVASRFASEHVLIMYAPSATSAWLATLARVTFVNPSGQFSRFEGLKSKNLCSSRLNFRHEKLLGQHTGLVLIPGTFFRVSRRD
jgi:hypothetical protein